MSLPGAGVDPKDLEGQPKGKKGSSSREFFWDSIVLFMLSAILGLAAIDAITEFVRGSQVECYVDKDKTEITDQYINTFCSGGSLPLTQFFPPFIVISGVFIAAPHYLWLNQYGGNFEFFFSLVASLDRLKNEDSGEYCPHNYLVLQQLEAAFQTYKRNTIFYSYFVKLVLQLILCVVGITIAIVFFTDFDETFLCPEDISDSFWPLSEKAQCVFTSLELIYYIRILYIALVGLAIIGLLWALFWCWCAHPLELGSQDVANFAFCGGLHPKYYVSDLPVPDICVSLKMFLHRFVSTIPWISIRGPRIRTELDFMVMRLFRTDSGLGYVFKDIQVAKEMQNLIDNDQRKLNLHYKKHTTMEAKDTPLDKDELDMKWRFRKEIGKPGVYFDFYPVKGYQLSLPDLIQGTVLGFAARAPDNSSAISVSFGSTGYATCLARVFQWVGYLNFSPDYKNSTEHLTIRQHHTNVVSVVTRENILVSETTEHNEFILNLREIWQPDLNSDVYMDTGFVVIGPIDDEVHLTTVHLFLQQIAGCLMKDAVLLTVRPIMIQGKDVSDQFFRYIPSDKFTPLQQWKHDVDVFKGPGPREWYARKSVQRVDTKRPPPLPRNTPHRLTLRGIICGDAKCTIDFETYRYKAEDDVERPDFYMKQVPTHVPLHNRSLTRTVKGAMPSKTSSE